MRGGRRKEGREEGREGEEGGGAGGMAGEREGGREEEGRSHHHNSCPSTRSRMSVKLCPPNAWHSQWRCR